MNGTMASNVKNLLSFFATSYMIQNDVRQTQLIIIAICYLSQTTVTIEAFQKLVPAKPLEKSDWKHFQCCILKCKGS